MSNIPPSMSELYFAYKLAQDHTSAENTALVVFDFDSVQSAMRPDNAVRVQVFGFLHADDYRMHDFFDFEKRLMQSVECHKKFVYDLLAASNHAAIWLQNFLMQLFPESEYHPITCDHRNQEFKRTGKRNGINNTYSDCYRVDRAVYYQKKPEDINKIISSLQNILEEITKNDYSRMEAEYIHGYGRLQDLKYVEATSLSAEYHRLKEKRDKEESMRSMIKIVK